MFKSVLVPVDVETPDDASRIIKAAASLAAGWEADFHVASIVPDVGMSIVGSYFEEGFEKRSLETSNSALEAILEKVGVTATTHVLSGIVYDQVIELADRLEADLIIIGAHSPNLKDYLLGSNAARVIRHTEKSVLVLRTEQLNFIA